MAGGRPPWRADAGLPGMSAGVRARELAFVNGSREFAARLVIVERTVILERSANQFVS